MAPVEIFSLKQLCSAMQSPPESTTGIFWTIVTTFWPWGWLLVVVGLGIWITVEIKTRYTTSEYRSDNGFSPPFNTFVGGTTYFGLQALLYFLLELIFGGGVYCVGWPYGLHLLVFVSTGFLLRFSGFWTYLRILGESPRKRGRRGR